MPVRAITTATAFLIVALSLLCFHAARSTPMYAARAGRTCDNCHLTPNEWLNPALADRKCSLSCQVCHVDPAGGGMRNASGRFYGRATLPMVATSPRPTADWDRNFPGVGRRDRATTYLHDLPQGPSTFEESGPSSSSWRRTRSPLRLFCTCRCFARTRTCRTCSSARCSRSAARAACRAP